MTVLIIQLRAHQVASGISFKSASINLSSNPSRGNSVTAGSFRDLDLWGCGLDGGWWWWFRYVNWVHPWIGQWIGRIVDRLSSKYFNGLKLMRDSNGLLFLCIYRHWNFVLGPIPINLSSIHYTNQLLISACIKKKKKRNLQSFTSGMMVNLFVSMLSFNIGFHFGYFFLSKHRLRYKYIIYLKSNKKRI